MKFKMIVQYGVQNEVQYCTVVQNEVHYDSTIL